jgi:outer membrane immunogenic protein
MKFGVSRGAILASALTALVAFAPAASASEPDSGRPASWTGLYVGVHFGGAQSEVNWGDVSLVGLPVNNDASGIMGGGQIGYNAQFGRLVLGLEASISGAALSDRDFSTGGGISFGTSFNWIGTVTGRLGYAADHWMVYGKGGWAAADLRLSGNNPILPDSFSLTDTVSGWTAGAGIEWKLASNVSLAVEYNFIDLGTFDRSGSTVLGLPFTLSDVDVQVQSVTARINVRLP